MAGAPIDRSKLNPPPNQYSTAENEIRQFFQSLLNRDPTPEEIQQFTYADKNTWGQLIKSQLTPEEQKFGTWGNEDAPPPAPPPPDSGGTGGPSGGSILQPYSQPFTAPPPVDLGGPKGIPYIPPTPQPGAPPTYTPPAYTPPPAFQPNAWKPPSVEDALNDPGYKFRLDQGNSQLQNWAAAKGTLNDSSTGKALEDYGQNSASQEYGNVWNRDFSAWGANEKNRLDAYSTNYGTQYADPYKIAFEGSQASFAPLMAGFQANNTAQNLGYSTQAAAGQRQNELNYANDYNKWLDEWKMFVDQRDSTFNKTVTAATI